MDDGGVSPALVARGPKMESGKDEKKPRRGKSKNSGTKSKTKKSKSPSTGDPHSKGGNSTDIVTSLSDLGSADRNAESLLTGSRDDDVKQEEGGVSEEGPLKREDHSKSRSRSESRSRFSGFFKRKKRSKSETDLSQGANDESKKRCESAEDVKRKQAHKAAFQTSDSLDGATFTPKTNMKRTSPHHYYDSRIQPRDRLRNMTVRDAVKEQRLRRVDSASRSPRRRRHDYGDDFIDPLSGNRASRSDVKFSLDAKDQSPSTQTIPIQKTSTLPKTTKPSMWQPDLERSAFKKYSSNPEFNPTAADISSSTMKPGESAAVASPDPIDDSVEEFQVYSSLNRAADLDKYKISSHADPQNDGEDTKTLVNVSISSQEDDQKDSERKPSSAEVVDGSANKTKRNESLSKFLELRQHPPSLLSRYRSSSQSSDSGVTSRETSPANASAHRTARPTVKSKLPNSHERLSPARSAERNSEVEKSSNPYVVSSVPIPTPSVMTPRLSLNGTELDSESATPLAVRPVNIKLDDSQGEASSVSSSPQVSSMTSSFRSTDQGYDESGSGDSSDENSAFSTPPEETESKGDNKKHVFSPRLLEKALLTSGESRKETSDFQETLEKNEPEIGVKKDREYLSQLHSVENGKENVVEKDRLAVGQRYIPRGVRRSKSDISARYRSPRRLFRNTSSSGARSPATADQSFNGSLDAVTYSPSIAPKFDEDRWSASSTSTLTNFDIYNHRGGQNGLQRSEPKSLPVMGTAAQQKYRRTFSPSRAGKLTKADNKQELSSQVIVIPSEEPTSLPSPTSPASTPHLNIHSSDPSPTQTPSPLIPRRGILKPISKEKTDVLKNDPISLSPSETMSSSTTNDKKEKSNLINNSPAVPNRRLDLPPSYPDIEIRLGKVSEAKQPVVLTPEESKQEISQPQQGSISFNGTQETAPKVQTAPNVQTAPKFQTSSYLQAAAPKPPPRQKSLPLFPVFHGLEIGEHKDPVASNYSLADFIQEQSVVKWKQQVGGKEQKEEENTENKKVKGWRKSFKRKSKKDVSQLKKDKQCPKSSLGVNLESDLITDRNSQVSEYRLKNIDEGRFTVMVDKECQTSAWLINSIVSKKTPKLKKKALSVKKKKRRGSVVSDTFVPPDAQRHKEAHHSSSLGDLRKLPVTDTDFTKDHARIISLSSQLGRSPSVKRVTKKTGILRPEPVLAGTSHRSDTSKSDEPQELPKPKKLSLTAVILLKNRLAKFREKKRKEKESAEPKQEEELVESEVPSDTFVTIENELNLSKLEVSKETDIIDDIFEPEFSLDYNKKHLRFDPMVSEPMQSEEPLPPLLPSSSRRLRQRRESTMRERRRKCIHYCKKFVAFLFSHIGLCSLVVAYTIMGGVIFQALEDREDHSVRSGIRERREKVVGQLIALAVGFQKSESGMDNLSSEVNYTVLEYQEFIHRQTKEKGWDGVEGANEESLWTFASSLLYAITVTTTIGYGHVAPKTPQGRIVTIGYAVIGIPLTLLCLTNIGDVMATGFRLLYGKVCCGVCCTLFKPRRRRIPVDLEKGLGQPLVTTEDEQPDKPKEVIHVPTSLCLLLIAAYIFAGAMLFSMWESWDILTGSYFCFITLSTIGFGDIVPGMDSNAWAHEEKLVLCALYLVLGLSLIAMCFNLVQEDVKAKCRWLGMKLGIVEKPEAPI